MIAKEEKFFAVENLHKAGWGIILALLFFCCGALYNKIFGPPKVLVESAENEERVKIRTELSPKNTEIVELTLAIKELSGATKVNTDTTLIAELSREVDRLRSEVAKGKTSPPNPRFTGSAEISANATAKLLDYNSFSQYRLPDTVKGYISEKIFGVSSTSCPAKTVKIGEKLEVSFKYNDQKLNSDITPIKVSLDLIKNSTNLLQITEDWFNLRLGDNVFAIDSELKQGKYKLSYGFYLLNKLNGEYPPFYSQDCIFEVKSSN